MVFKKRKVVLEFVEFLVCHNVTTYQLRLKNVCVGQNELHAVNIIECLNDYPFNLRLTNERETKLTFHYVIKENDTKYYESPIKSNLCKPI